MVAAVTFWVAAGLVAYHHVGYPALLHLLVALKAQRARPRPAMPAVPPCVTVIVPAHNEATVIEAKVRNLASFDYPTDRLTVVLALDGCTDATRQIAEATIKTAPSVRFHIDEYHPNVGKVAVLNDQIARAAGEIVALTDASALVAGDAIGRAAAVFADPSVGVVTGRYSVAGLDGRGEAAYWRYQSDVRVAESALAGPVGAHGAFYLFRRAAWRPLPPDTINDDFVLPMSIVLAGFRAAFEPDIVATELERSKVRQEFRRRVRIGAGNLQQAMRLARLADPRRGWVAFAFMSGKGLRGILPFLLTLMGVATVALAAEGSIPFALLMAVEGAGIALAIWGMKSQRLREGRLSGPLIYALQGYAALWIGAAFVLLRREGRVWKLSKTA